MLHDTAEQQAHQDTAHHTALSGQLTAAQSEREQAEEQVKQALLRLEQAYKAEKTIVEASRKHDQCVETRGEQMQVKLKEMDRRAEDATQVKAACEKSRDLLRDCHGTGPKPNFPFCK